MSARDAFRFLDDAVVEALSSAEAAAALSSCGDFMECEIGVRRALRDGASSGTSALLTRLDAERPPHMGMPGMTAHRRGDHMV